MGSASATVNIKVNALTISYNSPKVYTAGAIIPPLAPTVTGTVSAPAIAIARLPWGSGSVIHGARWLMLRGMYMCLTIPLELCTKSPLPAVHR